MTQLTAWLSAALLARGRDPDVPDDGHGRRAYEHVVPLAFLGVYCLICVGILVE